MSHLELLRSRPLTRFDRMTQFMRSIVLGPWNPRDKAIARYFGGAPVSSGVSVNEQTALTYSAVWAAVNLIASDIAAVPLKLYKRTDGGKDEFPNHPLYRLIHDQPNPQMPSAVFRKTLQAHRLVWGNGYAEIERDQAGRAVALWPLLPYAVTPRLEHGRLSYRVQGQDGDVTLAAADILHLRGLADDGICGLSVIQRARESLGLGIAAEQFGATFFGNGSTFGGVISYPTGLKTTDQSRKENREALENQHQGPSRAHRFLALYEGAKYDRLGIPPNDAQFLETRQFQIEEVCRWFRVPPHKVQHLLRSTFSNIEQQSIEYVTDTLEPHWVDWEQELTMKLIAPLERSIQVIEHVREGRLRGDSVSRSDLQTKQFAVAALTPNEIRAQENRNAIPNGDDAFVSLQNIPIDLAREYWQASIDKMKQPPAPPAPPNNQGDGNAAEQKALREALELSRHATQLAEDARDLALAERDTEQQAHRGTRETVAAAKQASDDALEQATRARREADARVEALTSERDRLTARGEMIEGDYQRVCRELSDEQAGRASEIEGHAATARAASERAAQLETELSAALVVAAGAQGAREAALLKASAVEAERDTATIAVSHAENERATAVLTAETANRALAASLTDLELLKTDLARARADIATELDRRQAQKSILLAAMRSLFVDASERLLQREIDRARKNQATPEKFRDWLSRFYPLHGEICRAAFQPLVGAWTAIAGGTPGVLLERLVREHLEASTTALQFVAELDEPDAMSAQLERTLYRWEHERADTMADALVREGMADRG